MAIALAQSSHHVGNAAAVTVSVDGVAQGNTLVVAVATVGAGGATQGPKNLQLVSHQVYDTTGNDLRLATFIRPNVQTASHRFTFSWPRMCDFAYVVLEFSGMPATNDWKAAVDSWVQFGKKGSSTNPNTTGSGFTTGQTNMCLVGFIAARNNDNITNTDGTAPLTGWTQDGNPRTSGANDITKVSLAAYHNLQASSGVAPDLSKTIASPSGAHRIWVALVIALAPVANITKGMSAQIRPLLTVSPDLSGGTPLEGAPASQLIKLVSANGQLWMAGGTGNLKKKVFYSSNGTSWTQQSTYTPVHAIKGMTGGPTKAWVWEHSANHQRLMRIDASTQTVFAKTQDQREPLGLAYWGGFLYRWTGAALYEYDTSVADTTLPLTSGGSGEKVYSTGIHPSGVRGDIAATDHSVVFFYSLEGRTTVYEYVVKASFAGGTAQRVGTASVIWEPQLGFTAKAMCYSQGTIYLLGDYNGKLTLMGLPPSGTPVFFGFVREDLTLTARSCSPGLGNTILLTATDAAYNYVWVYDAALDAFSLLDRFARSGNGDVDQCVTFTDKRVAALSSSTTVNAASWGHDKTADTSATGVLVTGAWDFNVPEQDKILIGFNVLHDPLITSKSFSVDYQINESGSYTVGPVQSGNTSVASTYIPITTNAASPVTVKFKQLRLQINWTNIQIYSVSALCRIPGYYETFQFILRLKNEQPGQRIAGRQANAETVRASLRTSARNKTTVTLLDGYPYKKPGVYDTYAGTIEDVQDEIARNHEGPLQLTFRVSPTA